MVDKGNADEAVSVVCVAIVCIMLDGLSLTDLSAFGNCAGNEGEHFFDGAALEETKCGEVSSHAYDDGVFVCAHEF